MGRDPFTIAGRDDSTAALRAADDVVPVDDGVSERRSYAIGGTIIERVSGMPWDAFIRSRIFAPLGMNESEPLVAGIIGKPNVAMPHARVGDSARVVPIRSTDPVASAGSVWSSVSDMSKWMRFVLDSGRVGHEAPDQRRRRSRSS